MPDYRLTRSPGPYTPMAPEAVLEPSSTLDRIGPQQQQGAAFFNFLGLLERRGWYLFVCFTVSILSAWFYVKHQTPIYSSTATLLITPSSTHTGSTSAADEVIDEIAGRNETRSLDTQVAILKEDTIRDKALRRLNLSSKEIGHGDITVAQVGDTNLVTITVDHPKPQIAQLVANNVADVYLEWTRQNNQAALKKASDFLRNNLNVTRYRLEQAEKDLAAQQERLGTPDIDAKKTALVDSYYMLQSQLGETRAQRQAAEASLRSLTNQLNEPEKPVIEALTTSPNPMVLEYQTQLINLETQRAALLKEYQPDQPEITSLDSQIRDFKNELNKAELSVVQKTSVPQPMKLQNETAYLAARTDAISLAAREKVLTQELASLQGEVNQLPSKDRILMMDTREAQTLSDAYSQILQKWQEIRMDEEAKLADGQVIESAALKYPLIPVRPKKLLTIAGAGIAGLLLGLLMMLSLESMDRTFRDPSMIEEMFGIPILAGVPMIKPLGGGKKRSAYGGYGYDSSALEEGGRLLQAALAYQNPDQPIRTVMIASPLPSEGKTTLTRQLGRVVAESGKRVILIDADYRRPGLTRDFNARNQQGLTNVVVGQTDLDSVLIATETPDLFILPTGTLPSNPSSFIQSQRFTEVIEDLKKSADLLIFDVPPLVVTDALFLSEHVDGVILVVVPGKTLKAAINRAVDLLGRVQANLIGVCLNKVTRSTISSYYSYYGYGYYGYGYGYGSYGYSSADSSKDHGRSKEDRPGMLPEKKSKKDTDDTVN